MTDNRKPIGIILYWNSTLDYAQISGCMVEWCKTIDVAERMAAIQYESMKLVAVFKIFPKQ